MPCGVRYVQSTAPIAVLYTYPGWTSRRDRMAHGQSRAATPLRGPRAAERRVSDKNLGRVVDDDDGVDLRSHLVRPLLLKGSN